MIVAPLGDDGRGAGWTLYSGRDEEPEIRIVGTGAIRADLAFAVRYLNVDTLRRWALVVDAWLQLGEAMGHGNGRPANDAWHRCVRTARRALDLLESRVAEMPVEQKSNPDSECPF